MGARGSVSRPEGRGARGEGEGWDGLSYQPSQKVVWSLQFGAPPVPSHCLQSSWPHVYELHLVVRVQVRVKPWFLAP